MRRGHPPERRLEQLEPLSPSTVLRIVGGDAPCVGRPSVTMNHVVRRAESVRVATAKAFSRLVPSCGTSLRSCVIASLSAFASLASSHLPALPATSGFAWVLNAVDLELRLGGSLRRDPVDGRDRAPPLVGRQPARLRHVAQADHVDHRLVEHARRGVDEHQDPVAAELEPDEVLAIAGALKPLTRLPGCPFALRARPRAGGGPPRATSGPA